MLNNITNFFNLIRTGMVKSQLESSDLLPVGTRDSAYGGSYKPTMVKYSDLAAQILAGVPPLTIGTTPIVSGTVGRILFEGTGNVVQESANITWDNTNAVFSLGTLATKIINFKPADTSSIFGNTSSIRGGVSGRIDFLNGSNLTHIYDGTVVVGPTAGPYIQVGSTSIAFAIGGTERARIAATTGNVLINTTTDAGFKLDVNGTARTQQLHTFLQGTYLDVNTSNNYHRVYTGASTYGGLQLQNEIVNYTGYITTGRSGNQLGINFFHTTYAGGVSASSHQKFTQGGVQFGSFSLPNTLTVFNVGGGNGTVNYPIIANNQLNTTNTGVGYLFQTGDITGSGPINHAAISAWKTNGAAPSITSSLRFYTISDAANSLTEKMRIADSGNVLINTTTDSGFRLDVNGTARTGAFTSSSSISATTSITAANSDGFNLTGGTLRISAQGSGATATIGIVTQDQVTYGYNHAITFTSATTLNTQTSGAATSMVRIRQTFQVASSATSYTSLLVDPTINQTGTANGAVRGFYYNPTVTSVLGTHHAIHTTAGRVRFEGLPTSSVGLSSGDIWNDGGIVKIV